MAASDLAPVPLTRQHTDPPEHMREDLLLGKTAPPPADTTPHAGARAVQLCLVPQSRRAHVATCSAAPPTEATCMEYNLETPAQLTFAHRANALEQLRAALAQPAVHFVEADLSWDAARWAIARAGGTHRAPLRAWGETEKGLQ